MAGGLNSKAAAFSIRLALKPLKVSTDFWPKPSRISSFSSAAPRKPTRTLFYCKSLPLGMATPMPDHPGWALRSAQSRRPALAGWPRSDQRRRRRTQCAGLFAGDDLVRVEVMQPQRLSVGDDTLLKRLLRDELETAGPQKLKISARSHAARRLDIGGRKADHLGSLRQSPKAVGQQYWGI